MKLSPILPISVAALGLVLAGPALAQSIPSGTYAMPDSGYSITVEPQGSDLLVNEAGKDRTYVNRGGGTYEYRSDITGATYQLVYRDRGSVAAIKKGSGGAPTLLIRQGGAAPDDARERELQNFGALMGALHAPKDDVEGTEADRLRAAYAPTQDARSAAPARAPASPYLAVAERYQALTISDPKNVQSWAFCSAAALKRSMAVKAEADSYGREAAKRLASISVDPARNPCPDAIPNDLWPGADKEAEALKQANAAQSAAAAAQAAEIKAMRAKQAADQAAYAQAKAEHEAALAKARDAQALFERQQADYQAELARQQAGQRR